MPRGGGWSGRGWRRWSRRRCRRGNSVARSIRSVRAELVEAPSFFLRRQKERTALRQAQGERNWGQRADMEAGASSQQFLRAHAPACRQRVHGREGAERGGVALAGAADQQGEDALHRPVGERGVGTVARVAGGDPEIRRESCRGRGWQYVENTG